MEPCEDMALKEVLAVAALLYLFRQRGWMGRGGTS
jgi:hypothetical protein